MKDKALHTFLPCSIAAVKHCTRIRSGGINQLCSNRYDVCRTVHRNIFYSKTKQMYNISNLFYFGTTFYVFRTVSLSIIRSLRLYIQHQVYVTRFCSCLLARTLFQFRFTFIWYPEPTFLTTSSDTRIFNYNKSTDDLRRHWLPWWRHVRSVAGNDRGNWRSKFRHCIY
jgi:hypothetical protein